MAFSMRLVVALFALTFSDASRMKVTTEAKGDCSEPAVEEKCVCKMSVQKKGSYQCVACKDPSKWGHGCELDCPARCAEKCDFSGNCLVDDPCPANCKRNGRAEHPTDKSMCLNSEGTCQSCDQASPGYYGLMCESRCPENCELSKHEGICTRLGSCYKCKAQFYGESCDKRCPSACPKGECRQKDGVDDDGEFMPAGSCLQQCPPGFHGLDCSTRCPDNCDASGCSRDAGVCKKCKSGFWGERCDKGCSSGCVGGICRKIDGFCEKGCNPGFWGDDCSKDCPQYSIKEKGCDRNTGLPAACDATHYPALDAKGDSGSCIDCPVTCKDSKCGDDGLCSEGCIQGFYGKACDETCADNCVGGCDQTTGQCNACAPGTTGKFCKERCHYRCKTCVQFHVGSKTGKPGNQKEDCLTCPADDASELASQSGPAECKCIKSAHRNDENAPCTCEKPSDEFMEPILLKEEDRYKKCSTKCKEDHNGSPLRDVYGKNVHKCITIDLYLAVVVAFHGATKPELGGASCKPDEYPIDVQGATTCLRQEFAKYITGQK